MSVINTNSLSLVAQGNLTKSQNALGTAIERLSSGLRINSAKDDAAGQAIANRFTSNVKGLAQAGRNANDGISIAQTTEGALNEINNNLQRVRELTVQAANGTNSASDLRSIQDEIKQRLDEIDRVSEQTQFNGIKVLAKDTALKIQVGANDNETIDVNLKQIDSAALGLDKFNISGPQGTTSAATFKNDEGTTATVTVSLTVDGGTVSGTTTIVQDANKNLFVKADVTVDGTTSTVYYGISESDVKIADGATTGTVTLSNIAVSKLSGTATSDALQTLDKALADVDSLRSELGAVQNRFESTIANLNNTVNNLSAARSRIEDADYAVEVSNMTRAQILQQAGTSVLAQANQVPQGVLSLLQ